MFTEKKRYRYSVVGNVITIDTRKLEELLAPVEQVPWYTFKQSVKYGEITVKPSTVIYLSEYKEKR